MIDNLMNQCHTDLRFINNNYLTFPFTTLKVQDIHFLFSESISFTFFEVPMCSTRSPLKVTTPREWRKQKGVKSESNEGRYFR